MAIRRGRIGGNAGTAATALCLLLAGCGGGGGSTTAGAAGGIVVTPTPTPAPVTAPTPSPSPAPAPSTLAEIVARYTVIDLDAPDNYANPTLPAYYDNSVAGLDNAPNGDPVRDSIATLGRVLFYDKHLSTNDGTACASCHQQAHGFDDTARFSSGVAPPQVTTAHAMRLGNVRYYQPGTMFWDKRAASIEDQASQPILNPVEMGWQNAGGIDALIAKMRTLEYYPALFEFAFGDATITEARMQRALAQFERAMISADSRWDRAYAQVFAPGAPNRNLNVDLPGFTAQENRGRQLFMTAPNTGGAGCSACHQPPTFALDRNSRSNGLDAGETTEFKAPSLKNVALSAFFMHDGRFTSLAQVIAHYDNGVLNGPALDNRLRQGNNPQRLNLSQADQAALAAFLGTLTDTSLTTDPRFGNPFLP